MAAIVNARDVLLQAATSRTTVSPNSSITLAPSASFHVTTGGSASPSSIPITAILSELEGTVTFTPTGCTLSGTSGNTTNVAYTDMPGATASVVASLTLNGVTVTSNTLYLSKTVDGSSGTSGTSVFVGTIYKQQVGSPTTPSGGTFNFNTQTLTAPSGWTATQPASSTTPTWAAQYTFSTVTPGATVTAGTWGTPVAVAQNGAAGSSGSRGAGTFYGVGSSWSDATADAATPGGNVVDDVVTISNGTNFAFTKRWDGTAWVSITTVIDGGLLVPGTVAAGAVSAAQLSALSAFLGAVEIATTGSLRSGQTAYNTGTGFWLGLVSGVAKFSFGSASGARITWDGSVLTIIGETKDTFSVSLGGITAGSYGPYTNGTTQTIGTKTSSVTGGVAPYTYSWSVTSEGYDGNPATCYASGGTTGTSITVKASGTNMWQTPTFTLVVTDANGRTCTASAGTLIKFGTYTP